MKNYYILNLIKSIKKKYYLLYYAMNNAISKILAYIVTITITPLALIIYIINYNHIQSPVIFKQKRPGLHGQPFEFYKFRTMTNEKDQNGNLLSDELRITSFGSWLRRTSLDELPSLINVLKGDMNLVGPRPLLMEYLPLYNSHQARRHAVKPGITGWAQVNGRNLLSWEEKFDLDVWYVDNRSLMLDIKILILTVWKVIKREGISANNHATMELFRGD